MPTQNEVSFVAKSSSKSEAEGPDLAQIDNVFKHLTVEEPSEAFLEASSVVAPHKPESHDGPRFVVVAERPQTTAEKWSAAHCLLHDVKKIRRSINGFWTRYRAGNITLTAASIATNTATEIIRQKQEDYDAAFPGHAGFENPIKDFYAVQRFHRQEMPNKREQAGDIINVAMYDVADGILLPAYTLMASLSEIIMPNQLPMYRPGTFGQRDLSIP